MSRMSELHDDLSTIHTILLGQRQVATNQFKNTLCHSRSALVLSGRIQAIDDLLLEFEAAGVVWPGNVVELNA